MFIWKPSTWNSLKSSHIFCKGLLDLNGGVAFGVIVGEVVGGVVVFVVGRGVVVAGVVVVGIVLGGVVVFVVSTAFPVHPLLNDNDITNKTTAVITKCRFSIIEIFFSLY
jgi:hypothetical protein